MGFFQLYVVGYSRELVFNIVIVRKLRCIYDSTSVQNFAYGVKKILLYPVFRETVQFMERIPGINPFGNVILTYIGESCYMRSSANYRIIILPVLRTVYFVKLYTWTKALMAYHIQLPCLKCYESIYSRARAHTRDIDIY